MPTDDECPVNFQCIHAQHARVMSGKLSEAEGHPQTSSCLVEEESNISSPFPTDPVHLPLPDLFQLQTYYDE